MTRDIAGWGRPIEMAYALHRSRGMWSFNKASTQTELLVKEPSLTSRIHELRRLQTSLSETERWKVDLGAALDRAAEALPLTAEVATAYDAVWRALHHARHLVCEHGDVNQLIQVASEVRTDLAYHKERTKKEAALDKIIDKLQGEEAELPKHRRELLSLSHEAADDREGEWRRANRLLERRKSAGRWLFGALILCAAILPLALGEPGKSARIVVTKEFLITWPRDAALLVTVMLFGALGGIMSILVGQKAAKATSLEHHVELKGAEVRWKIGAASALIMYLLLYAKVIQVGNTEPPPPLSPIALLLCLIAGFSERLVVGQLDRLSNAMDTKSNKEDLWTGGSGTPETKTPDKRTPDGPKTAPVGTPNKEMNP